MMPLGVLFLATSDRKNPSGSTTVRFVSAPSKASTRGTPFPAEPAPS